MSEYIYERPDSPAEVVRDGWNVRIEWDFKQREEIVRCRDCKFCHKNHCEKRVSPAVSPSEFFWVPIEPDGFCKWGERRSA